MAVLRVVVTRCRECPLGAATTQTVWGEGPAGARRMLAGEQPCDREDLCGEPFVGPAGHLLDLALLALGCAREQVYVINAVKHFNFELRGKRRMHKTPGQLEIPACRHWLESEIAAIKPTAVVALEATAARSLLQRPVKVMRGRPLAGARGRAARAGHGAPSALLRGDTAQREQAFAQWVAHLALAS